MPLRTERGLQRHVQDLEEDSSQRLLTDGSKAKHEGLQAQSGSIFNPLGTPGRHRVLDTVSQFLTVVERKHVEGRNLRKGIS